MNGVGPIVNFSNSLKNNVLWGLTLYVHGVLNLDAMSGLVDLLVCQTHWSYAQIIFPVGFASQGDLKKDGMMATCTATET
jgi:hypothetical protein